MVGRGSRTTALNECAGSYKINFINKKLVWDRYLIALRYRLFIQSYIHIHNSFEVFFFKIYLLCFLYIYIYIYIYIFFFIKPSELTNKSE